MLLVAHASTCETIRSVGGSFRRAVGVTYLSSLAVLTPLILRSNHDDNLREKALRTQLFSAIRPNSRVLEIGFGSGGGANMEYYPAHAGVEVTGLDQKIIGSDLHTIRKKYSAGGVSLEALVAGGAESLSQIFPRASFDVVVGTLVMCSVRDPERVLTEIAKVLKPKSGLFLSVEHVHATKTDSALLARTQELLDPLQQVVADNCHLTRRTDELFATLGPRLGLRLERCDPVFFPSQFPICSQVYSRLRAEDKEFFSPANEGWAK